MEFQYTHGVPLRRWDPASTYKYNWPLLAEKRFLQIHLISPVIWHTKVPILKHIWTPSTKQMLSSPELGVLSPLENKQTTKNPKYLILILLRHQKWLTFSALFFTTSSLFLSLSLQIFPPLFPPKLLSNSSKARIPKHSHLHLSSQLQQAPTQTSVCRTRKKCWFEPTKSETPASVSSLNSKKL